MWESLLVITVCYVAAQIMLVLGYRRAVTVPLSLACGLTIMMLLAVFMANLQETTTWISLPGEWVLSAAP